MTVRVDKDIGCFRNESVSDININKEGIYVVGNIEGIQTAILVDTGASGSILSSNFVEKSNMTDKLEMKPCSVSQPLQMAREYLSGRMSCRDIVW